MQGKVEDLYIGHNPKTGQARQYSRSSTNATGRPNKQERKHTHKSLRSRGTGKRLQKYKPGTVEMP